MAKIKKPKPMKVRKPMDPERARRMRVMGLHLSLAALLIGGIGAGYHYADTYVEQRVAFTRQSLIVILKNRPAWMNDFLVEQIAQIARPAAAHSAFDHKLLEDTADSLSRNPWIRKVHSVAGPTHISLGTLWKLTASIASGRLGEMAGVLLAGGRERRAVQNDSPNKMSRTSSSAPTATRASASLKASKHATASGGRAVARRGSGCGDEDARLSV